MHLRLVTARSGPIVRRYTQLVQSYRREDGMPAQWVVVSLGSSRTRRPATLRAALEASRQGKALVLPVDAPWRPRVLAKLAALGLLHRLILVHVARPSSSPRSRSRGTRSAALLHQPGMSIHIHDAAGMLSRLDCDLQAPSGPSSGSPTRLLDTREARLRRQSA